VSGVWERRGESGESEGVGKAGSDRALTVTQGRDILSHAQSSMGEGGDALPDGRVSLVVGVVGGDGGRGVDFGHYGASDCGSGDGGSAGGFVYEAVDQGVGEGVGVAVGVVDAGPDDLGGEGLAGEGAGFVP